MSASFIIRAYNAEKTIRRTIESALKQDFPHDAYEIIIVDDGSTDNTYTIASSFNVPMIRLFRQENTGIAGAGKTGVKEARGDFFVFSDADDEMMMNALSSFAVAFQEDVAYVYGDYFEEYQNETKLVHATDPFKAPAGAFAWHRERFLAEGGLSYDTIFPEYDILFRTWGRWKGAHVSNPVFVYHRSKDSMTGNKTLIKQALQKFRDTYPEREKEIRQIRSYMLS